MATTARTVTDVCREAKRASRALAGLDTDARNGALEAIAAALEARTAEVLEANQRDMEAGRAGGLDAALLDRLALDEARLAGIASDVRSIVRLPDPVGEVLEGFRLPHGIDVRRVRTPLGGVATG